MATKFAIRFSTNHNHFSGMFVREYDEKNNNVKLYSTQEEASEACKAIQEKVDNAVKKYYDGLTYSLATKNKNPFNIEKDELYDIIMSAIISTVFISGNARKYYYFEICKYGE